MENNKNLNSKSLEHKKIDKKSLLLVEGKDECHFFSSLFEKISIENVKVYDVGGKDKFSKTIARFVKIEGFSEVTKLGFVRDAEENLAKSAFDSICNDLDNNNIPKPKNIGKVEKVNNMKIGIFIMPNNKDAGMLETLCLQSIKNEHCQNEMEAYIECLRRFYKDNVSFNFAKAMSQVYLASKVPLVNSLGLGAEKGYWNFNDPLFNEIKSFLIDLFI